MKLKYMLENKRLKKDILHHLSGGTGTSGTWAREYICIFVLQRKQKRKENKKAVSLKVGNKKKERVLAASGL